MENYSYKINLKNNLSNYDLKTLQYLYLPIIGSGAFATFNCLLNESALQKEFRKKEFDITRLAKISASSVTNLQKDIEKLSAMGLLKIMAKSNQNKKLFNLYAPLEPSEFLANEIFAKALLKKIGKEDFEVVTYIFRDDSVSSEEYVEEKACFSKVFKDEAINILELEPTIMKLKKGKTNLINNKISHKEISHKLGLKKIALNLETVAYEEIFKKISSLYQLNSQQVYEAILECYDYENEVLLPEKLFEYITLKNIEIQDIDNKDGFALKKCREMEALDPIDYLELLQEGKHLTKASKNIIQLLKTDFAFSNGIINCLLEFSYYKNSREIVGNYIIKIAESVNDLKICKTIDLMNYLKQAHKESIKNRQVKKIKPVAKQEIKEIAAKIDWEAGIDPERYQAKIDW